MKKLSKYQRFDTERFFEDVVLELKKVEKYIDKDEKEKIKILATIEEDNSEPETAPFGPNQFENLNIKTDIVFSEHNVQQLRQLFRKKIELVEPDAKIWGDFRNQLSVRAKLVRPFNEKK